MHIYFMLVMLKEAPSYVVIKTDQVRKRTDVNTAFKAYLDKRELSVSLKETLVEGGYGEIIATPSINKRSWDVSIGSVIVGKLFAVERPMSIKIELDDETYYFIPSHFTGPNGQQHKVHPADLLPYLKDHLIIECLN